MEHIACLPRDWELQSFLVEIAGDLDSTDLEKMKYIVSGQTSDGGISKAVMEKLDSALKLFKSMQERDMLSRYNLLYLQAMIWRTGKTSLIIKMAEFAENQPKMVHFFLPRNTPENGYTHVKVHVRGTTDFDTNQLFELRALMARLVSVPEKFVIIDGIESSNSVIITFMMPKVCQEILTCLKEDTVKCLARLNADITSVSGNKIDVIESQSDVPCEKMMPENQIQDLLKREHQMSTLIDNLERSLIDLRSEQRKQQTSYHALIMSVVNTFYELRNGRLQKKDPELARNDNALIYLKTMWKKVKENKYDEELISELIEANIVWLQTTMYGEFLHDSNCFRIASNQILTTLTFVQREYELSLKRLQTSATLFSFPLAGITGIHTIQTTIQLQQLSNPQELKVYVGEPMLRYSPGFREAHEKISKELKGRDMKLILDSVDLNKDEQENIQAAGANVLLLLFDKKFAKSQDLQKSSKFVMDTLTKIGRGDLISTLLECIHCSQETKTY